MSLWHRHALKAASTLPLRGEGWEGGIGGRCRLTTSPPELVTALAFLEAMSRRDEPALFALAHADIAIVGPKGTAKGHPVLKRWFDGVRLRVEPKTALVREDRVLVLHAMTWLDDTGATSSTLDNASLLHVTAGRVSLYMRDDAPGPVRRQGFRGAPEFQLHGQSKASPS